jgi:hypothetical protein
MPKYRNSFRGADFIEETIVDEGGAVVGIVRIKPSSVLWKPKGKHSFLCVTLDKFAEWMEDPNTGAKSTTS